MLPTMFHFIWPSVIRGEDFQKSTIQKQELHVVAMCLNGWGRNEQYIQRTFQRCFLSNFGSFQQSGFRGEDFQKSTNQKHQLPVAAMFVNGSGQNQQSSQRTSHRCFPPSFGSFGQTVSEEKNLKNQPIRNKNHLWRPCLLMDWDEMSNLYRGLPQMLPTKFQFIWLSGFRGEDFLEINQSETRIVCGGHVC